MEGDVIDFVERAFLAVAGQYSGLVNDTEGGYCPDVKPSVEYLPD